MIFKDFYHARQARYKFLRSHLLDLEKRNVDFHKELHRQNFHQISE